MSWGGVTRRNVELFTVVAGARDVLDALHGIRAAAPKRLSRT